MNWDKWFKGNIQTVEKEDPKSSFISELQGELKFEDISRILKEVKTMDPYSKLGIQGQNTDFWSATVIWLVYFKIICDKIEELEKLIKEKS